MVGPPFTGEVRDGLPWGRGAVDMKSAVAIVLAAVGQWAREGRRPPRDIVLAFTADEEDTAAFGARWLVDRHPDLLAGCAHGIGGHGSRPNPDNAVVRLAAAVVRIAEFEWPVRLIPTVRAAVTAIAECAAAQRDPVRGCPFGRCFVT